MQVFSPPMFLLYGIDLMNYCILIDFTIIQWPDMFCKLPIVYQYRLLYILHAHRNASFTVCMWLLLINGITARGIPLEFPSKK